MATGTIPNNLAADVNALKSGKVDFVNIYSTGGHTSDASKTALHAVVDALSDGEVRFGHMGAGDQGLLLILRGSVNYAVVFYFTYNWNVTNKAIIKSMSKYNNIWGDWVTISQ